MSREFAKQFYKSRQWRDCRKGYLASIFGKCERCEMPAKIVHHKIELTQGNINDPNIGLSWDNLEAVYQDCPNLIHHGSGEDPIGEDVMFDEYGDLVSRCPPI